MINSKITRRSFGITMSLATVNFTINNLSSAVLKTASNYTINTVDTHSHIFKRGLKTVSNARYIPEYEATIDDYLGVLDSHSVSHGVLVQPSFLGNDNSYLISGLKANLDRIRGIAVIPPTTSLDAMAEMSASGIVGIRLNLIGAVMPNLKLEPWPKFLSQLKQLNWCVEVHHEAKDLPLIVNPLIDAGLNVVIDHFGRPDPKLGVSDPGFESLLLSAKSKRLWMKLSGSYRNGANGRGEAIALEAVPLLKSAFGLNRLLWGSDWPHTQFESGPTYGSTLLSLNQWIPDIKERDVVLRLSPSELYGFKQI